MVLAGALPQTLLTEAGSMSIGAETTHDGSLVGSNACWQMPVALHWSSVQTSPSLVQAEPAASY